jgi:hypothetical protein
MFNHTFSNITRKGLFTEINKLTQHVKGIVFSFLDTVAPQIEAVRAKS